MTANLLYIVDRFAQLGREQAYVFRRGYRTLRWTYGKLASTARQFARELERRDINKGDRVLLWGDNCAEWVAAFWGCVLRGVVVVPMDRVASPDFAMRVADQVSAKFIVCSRELASHAVPHQTIILEDLPNVVSSHANAAFPSPEIARTDPLQIVFTSGTTADPKGVVITHGNVLANLEPLEREIANYLKYERFFHPLRFLDLLPLSHVFGQFLGLFVPQVMGATVVFHDSLNPSEVMKTIRDERISVVITVPRLLESLRHKIERDLEDEGKVERFRRDFKHSEGEHFVRRMWRFRYLHRRFGWKFWAFVSGGAALDEATEQFWQRAAFAVVQGYGLTETTSLISVNHPFKIGARSIGKVLPGRELRLDPDTGEILVRGENIANTYWQGRELKAVEGDSGWFRTGDLGAIDEAGNLYFKGRKKNVIVTPAGMNVYPEDLESALRAQPAIKDCVVVPLPIERNAEPCAVLITADSDESAEAAVRAANKRLAEYQQIRRWLVWPEDDFPRTSTQKPKTNIVAQYAIEHFTGSGAAVITATTSPLSELVERITGRKVALAPNARLESDLNLSSIDRVELMSAIEDRYQIDLSESAVSNATTIADLEKLLRDEAKSMPHVRSGAGTATELTRDAPDLAHTKRYHYPQWAQRWPHTWIRTFVYHVLTYPYTWLMARPRIIGRENLDKVRGPYLIVSNHITYIDIGFVLFALPFSIRKRLAVAMQGERLIEMRRPPRDWNILKRWTYQVAYVLTVGLFNVFPLPQKSGFRDAFEFAGASADRGNSIVVFPEGRRTSTGELQPFQYGIGLLATRLNLPVVPVRIDGLWEPAHAGKHYVSPGAITVRIGAPVVYPPNAAAETIARDLERRVKEL